MLERLKIILHIKDEILFEDDKKQWSNNFISELNKVLADEDLMLLAFNQRGSLRKNKIPYNNFDHDELFIEAFDALDSGDETVYDFNDKDRVGNDLPWYSKKELNSMPRSIVAKYEAAIFYAKAESNDISEPFYLDLLSKTMQLKINPKIQLEKIAKIQNDKGAFTTSLSNLAEPIIRAQEEQRLQKPKSFFERHPWVKYALIGAAVAVAVIAIGVGTAASFGALPAVSGAAALIGTLGGLLVVKKAVAITIGLAAICLALTGVAAFAGAMIGRAMNPSKPKLSPGSKLVIRTDEDSNDELQGMKEDEEDKRRIIVKTNDPQKPITKDLFKHEVDDEPQDKDSDSEKKSFRQ